MINSVEVVADNIAEKIVNSKEWLNLQDTETVGIAYNTLIGWRGIQTCVFLNGQKEQIN